MNRRPLAFARETAGSRPSPPRISRFEKLAFSILAAFVFLGLPAAIAGWLLEARLERRARAEDPSPGGLFFPPYYQLLHLEAGALPTLYPGLLWRPDPESFLDTRFPGSINRWGYRDDDFAIPKPPGVFRIVIAGDSNTFGPLVFRRDRVWPNALEAMLNDRPPIAGMRFEVVNLGVPGYDAVQCMAALKWIALPHLEPDLAIYAASANDAEVNDFFKDRAWVHFGIRGREGREEDSRFSEPSRLDRALFRARTGSFVLARVTHRVDAFRYARLMPAVRRLAEWARASWVDGAARRIHPAGVQGLVETLCPESLLGRGFCAPEVVVEERPADLVLAIDAMAGMASAAGVPFGVAVLPHLGERRIDPEGKFERFLRSVEAARPSLPLRFVAGAEPIAPPLAPGESLVIGRYDLGWARGTDDHPSEAGHRVLAEALLPWVAELVASRDHPGRGGRGAATP